MLRLLLLAGGVFATAGVSFAQFMPGSSLFNIRPVAPVVVTATATVPVATSTPTPPPVVVAKTSVTIDYSKPYTSLHSGPAVAKKETFGTVYTTFNLFGNYKKAVDQVPNYSLRWPGGSFAETNPLYSLTHPDIYNEPAPGAADYRAHMQRGLTDVMAYSVEKNIPFVMVIPTDPYFNNVVQGQTHLREFMIKLLRGDYGPIPASVTLEIGNENASVGWVNNKFTPGPGSYGFVTNAFLTTINSVLNDVTLNPQKKRVDAAIWIGSTEGGMPNIYKQITTTNMKTVDGFVHHIGLVPDSADYDFALTNRKIAVAKSYWSAAFGGRNVPEMKLIATEWNVGGCAKPKTAAEYKLYEIGARQAGTVVSTFSKMIGGGLDMGMLWGNQTCVSQMLWHEGETLSHGGQAYRLMAESLVGAQLLAGKVNTSGVWTKTATTHDVTAYRTATSTIIFLSAADIPASGLDVTFTLSNFGTIKSITTDRITTRLTQPGESWPEDDRAYEEPIMTSGTLTPVAGKFTYRLTEDFETVRIIVGK
jgi:hypothetical protein